MYYFGYSCVLTDPSTPPFLTYTVCHIHYMNLSKFPVMFLCIPVLCLFTVQATLLNPVSFLYLQGLTVVGTFLPNFLPAWPLENIALWLSLAEGLLLPPLLGLVDATFSEAAASSCSRDKSRQLRFEGKCRN